MYYDCLLKGAFAIFYKSRLFLLILQTKLVTSSIIPNSSNALCLFTIGLLPLYAILLY